MASSAKNRGYKGARQIPDIGKDEVIGYTDETFDNKEYVMKIWCKLCAKYRDQIIRYPSYKGAAVSSEKAFADGTPIVAKFQVKISLYILYCY